MSLQVQVRVYYNTQPTTTDTRGCKFAEFTSAPSAVSDYDGIYKSFSFRAEEGSTVSFGVTASAKTECGWSFDHWDIVNVGTGATATDAQDATTRSFVVASDSYRFYLYPRFRFVGSGLVMRKNSDILRVADKVLLDI